MQIVTQQETERTDGVVAAGEVVGGILLTGDQLLRVEELAVSARADLIDHGRLQVDLRNSKQRRIAYPLSEKHTRESHRTGERTVSENKMLPRMIAPQTKDSESIEGATPRASAQP